MMSTVWCL